MLVISRRQRQAITIGDDIRIVVVDTHRGSCRLGIEFKGKNKLVLRAEVDAEHRCWSCSAPRPQTADECWNCGKYPKPDPDDILDRMRQLLRQPELSAMDCFRRMAYLLDEARGERPRTWNKPPLGVMPRKLWEEQTDGSVEQQELRVRSLESAVRAYRDAGLDAKREWLEELEHRQG